MNSFNSPIPQSPQSPQPARDNRSAAQRRYRKKEEDGFSQLREALREVAKDDPRTRQEILRRASCELRRLADENHLLSQQKALIESHRGNHKYEHSQSPSCSSVIYEDPTEWSHNMAEVTCQLTDRARALDTAMSTHTPTAVTAQDYEWFTQLYDANMAQDSSQSNYPWASQHSRDFARRPRSGSDYYARCANCQHGE